MPIWAEERVEGLPALPHAPFIGAPRRRGVILALALTLMITHTCTIDPALAASGASPPLDQPIKADGGGWRPFSRRSFDDALLPPTPVPGDSPSNLLAPDLRTVPPARLRLSFLAQSEQLLLRFDNTIYNSGLGPMEVIGQVDPATGQTHVHQRLYTRTGATAELRVGEFHYHPTHLHWHMRDFALYEVLPVSPSGDLTAPVASNHKVSYCLMDLRVEGSEVGRFEPPRAEYIGCDKEVQGISVGWGDIYEYFRPDQWVDVTDLPDGLYALRSTVDPDNLLLERHETNNTAMVFFSLQGQSLQVLPGLRLPY